MRSAGLISRVASLRVFRVVVHTFRTCEMFTLHVCVKYEDSPTWTTQTRSR